MRKLLILATTLSLVIGAGLASAAPVDLFPPVLVDITLSTSSVTIAGLNVAHVTVSVHLKDDAGVIITCDDPDCIVHYPRVWFTRVGGGYKEDSLFLKLTSGTPTDGIWSRDWLVPSPHNGTWEATRVVAMDEGGHKLDVDPRQQGITRSLAVHGSHIPNVTMGFAPDPYWPGQSVTAKGRAYYPDTGAPIPNYRLYYGQDDPCLRHGDKAVVTDERGYWSYPYIPGQACVFLWRMVPTTTGGDDIALIVKRLDLPFYKLTLSVRLSDDRVALGSTTTFEGSSAAGLEHPINLQRFTAGAWRTVNTSHLRRSGRYTLVAQPPARGRFAYRVWIPARKYSYESGTVSRTYVVTAY